ncbi:flagellar hook-basal body protein [Paenibacillus gansuensis]|uniref:Flagellar hook-basal body protein n=1 Tax=Paenibacillus gansuensis TaxID=306542 RepID=A0ABW5PJP7_9BACL
MNRSMITAGVSMYGLQQKLDILANNIANVNTVGYKKQEASFQDVLTNVTQQEPSFKQAGRLSPLGYKNGYGTYLANVQTNFTSGALKESGNPLDLAVQGDALFQLSVANTGAGGQTSVKTAFTRGGNFQLSSLGDSASNYLTTQDGYLVMGIPNGGNPNNPQPVKIPKDHAFTVDAYGNITTRDLTNPYARPVAAGRLLMVKPQQPEMLELTGDNTYQLKEGAPANAMSAIAFNRLNPDANQPKIYQGFLEQSNVDLADEMTELMTVQRAFQLNSRALASSDVMAGLANNLRA